MKKFVMRALSLLLVIILVVFTTSCGSSTSETSPNIAENANYTLYECNAKVLSFNTSIEITKNGNFFSEINGEYLKVVTDPLKMCDANGNQIAYAGDTYHFIEQDSHGIYVNGGFTCDMVGQVEFLGEEYLLYDTDKKYIGRVEIPDFNVHGMLYDADENIVAEYHSGILNYDYEVKIYEDCPLDDISVLMIFASYHSDYVYDSAA